jgi:hypothetical protein
VKLRLSLLAFSVGAFAADSGIFGRVVDARTHEPLRRAIIKVSGSKEQWNEFTDGDGRFKFAPLARAEYTLIAHRDGYTDRVYKVELSDFDDPKELPIELRAQGLITGKVIDGFGEPLERARIEALNARASGGQVQVVVWAETNDLGEYRLSGIDPGMYRLRATYRAGREGELDTTPLTMATAIYGGSEKPAEIVVKSGSIIPGVDFVLTAVRPATIRGTLRTEEGRFNEPVAMWIMGQAGEGGHNGTGRDGVFALPDIGPGVYTVSAETSSKTERLFGSVPVAVRDADVNGVDILLRPSPKLEGLLIVEGGSSPDPKIKSILFFNTAPAMGAGIDSAHPDKNGKFELSLNPGEYTISFDSAPVELVRVTLNELPLTNQRFRMEPGAGVKRLVIVMKSKAKP